MAHNITIDEYGFAEAAYAKEPAWHGLGEIIDHQMTSEECLKYARLDWKVVKKPLAIKEENGYCDLPSQYMITVREDNGLPLGLVSNRYTIVQNTEAFEFMDELIENHEMKYEAAFSLSGGRRVVLLAQLPKVDFINKEDPILRYILMSLCHDGTGAIKFGPTNVRVVCANTLAVAARKKEVRDLSVAHKGDIKTKLNKARQILSLINDRFDENSEIYRQLSQKRITMDEWNRFLNIICPEPDEADASITKRTRNKIMEIRESLTRGFIEGENQNIPGIERTAWAAYNTVTELVDHMPRRGKDFSSKAEARFNTVLYGTGATHKDHALKTIANMVGVQLAV